MPLLRRMVAWVGESIRMTVASSSTPLNITRLTLSPGASSSLRMSRVEGATKCTSPVPWT